MERVSRSIIRAAVAFLFCLAALAAGVPRQRGPFTLALQAPKQPLKAGKPLRLHVTVKNISEHPIDIPFTRGSINAAMVYQVHVLDEQGHPAPPYLPPPPPKGKRILGGAYSVLGKGLQPGQSLTQEVSISHIYDLGRPGKYKIWIAEPFKRGPNGLVRSNTVRISSNAGLASGPDGLAQPWDYKLAAAFALLRGEVREFL